MAILPQFNMGRSANLFMSALMFVLPNSPTRFHFHKWFRRLRVFFSLLGIQSIATGLAQGSPVIVDHRNYNAIDTLPLPGLQALAHMKVFFAHASVGSDIIVGMKSLHSQNPKQYPLSCEPAKETPTSAKPGSFYEYNRGNPGAEAKIKLFTHYLMNGWHSPTVNVVINKFCFIDLNVSLNKYISAMNGLERDYPTTTFVYVTIPIITKPGPGNLPSHKFNESLRHWVRQNNKVLFDIADIEAWGDGGEYKTNLIHGKEVQSLREEYSSDGGHLNNPGQLRIAKGMFTLLSQIAIRH